MEELALDPQVRPKRRIFQGRSQIFYQRVDGSTELVSRGSDGSLLLNSINLPGVLRQAHDGLLLLEDGRLFEAISKTEYQQLTYVPDVAYMLGSNAVLTPEGYVYTLLFETESIRKEYRLDQSATLQQLGITRLQEDGQVERFVTVSQAPKAMAVPGAVAAITDDRGLTLLLEDGRLYTRSGVSSELGLVEQYQPHGDQPLPRHALLFNGTSVSIFDGSKYVDDAPPDGVRVLDGFTIVGRQKWLVVTDRKERSYCCHDVAGNRIHYLS